MTPNRALTMFINEELVLDIKNATKEMFGQIQDITGLKTVSGSNLVDCTWVSRFLCVNFSERSLAYKEAHDDCRICATSIVPYGAQVMRIDSFLDLFESTVEENEIMELFV